MTLEQELRALSTTLGWPDAPDVAARVRVAIDVPAPQPERRSRRHRVAVALAVVAAAAAATMAVPQARTAVLRALGIGGVRLVHVDAFPVAAPREDLSLLGPVLPRDQAARVFGARLLRFEEGLGQPDEVRALDVPEMVSYVWTAEHGVRLLVSQLRGHVPDAGFVKIAGPGATVERLRIEERPALWITGEAHGFGLDNGAFEGLRLSGNALLVDRGEETIRIEGAFDRDAAIRVYRALR